MAPPLHYEHIQAFAAALAEDLRASGVHTGKWLVCLDLGTVKLGAEWRDPTARARATVAVRQRFVEGIAIVTRADPSAVIAPSIEPSAQGVRLSLSVIGDEEAMKGLALLWYGPEQPPIDEWWADISCESTTTPAGPC